MPRGDKSAYTDKQKRQAEHIEEGYKEKGLSAETAEKRAWATVNKASGGGRKSGSGRGKAENKEPYVKGGIKGGAKGGRKGGRAAGKAGAGRAKAAKTSRSKAGKSAA